MLIPIGLPWIYNDERTCKVLTHLSPLNFKTVKRKGEKMGDTACKLRGQYIGGGRFCKERCNLSNTIDIS